MKLFGEFKIIEIDDTDNNIDIDINIENPTMNDEEHPVKDFFKFILNYMKEFWHFARIPFLVMILICAVITVVGVVTPQKQLSTKVNLVSEHYGERSAFLGYTFSKNLVESIESKDIDLYGVYVCKENGNINITFEDSNDAIPGTASKIKVVKIEYIAYSNEYMEKYFSPEYIEEIKARDEIPGYWNYTIDLK